jgi:hypothetical protein
VSFTKPFDLEKVAQGNEWKQGHAWTTNPMLPRFFTLETYYEDVTPWREVLF